MCCVGGIESRKRRKERKSKGEEEKKKEERGQKLQTLELSHSLSCE